MLLSLFIVSVIILLISEAAEEKNEKRFKGKR